MGQIKALALDFDNCIILDEKTRKGSEEVKDEAWFSVFPEIARVELEPVLEKIKKEIAGGKGDRKDIVTSVYSRFLSELTGKTSIPSIATAYMETEIMMRCDRYNYFVQEGIKRIGVSVETRRTIEKLSLQLPIYINTATPSGAILQSLDSLTLTKYFKGVLGRPKSKVENLFSIMASEDLARPTELLFVGDSTSDLAAAEKAGCLFVGMHTKRNKAWHTSTTFPLIFSLSELVLMIYDFHLGSQNCC